jgi:ribonuclease E
VRDLTLQSTAPCLVYEEGNLIKRSIRDLYSKDMEEIQVAVEAAHKEALDFMRMLSPSQAKNVIKFDEPEPLFGRYQIERQLNAMFSPYVTLRSGGYLVINQTEALVSIDVNSGKSTREFSIEETALQTNLEASDELARQLKLRDLAGLIVIDSSTWRSGATTARWRTAWRRAAPRPRPHPGRAHQPFRPLEMSRQRCAPAWWRAPPQCPHCQGTGIVRSTESVALGAAGHRRPPAARCALLSTAVTTAEVALYILTTSVPSSPTWSAATASPSRWWRATACRAPTRYREVCRPRGAASAERPAAVNMEWGFEGQDGEEAVDEGGDAEAVPSPGRGRRRRRGESDERRSEPTSGAARSRGGRRRGGGTSGDEPRGRPEPARLAANGDAMPAA